MQATIADQLGLKVSTVANFFMNARRRSLDKYLEDSVSRDSMHANNRPNSAAMLMDVDNGLWLLSEHHASIGEQCRNRQTVTKRTNWVCSKTSNKWRAHGGHSAQASPVSRRICRRNVETLKLRGNVRSSRKWSHQKPKRQHNPRYYDNYPTIRSIPSRCDEKFHASGSCVTLCYIPILLQQIMILTLVLKCRENCKSVRTVYEAVLFEQLIIVRWSSAQS